MSEQKIVLDVMGGDNAPASTIEGAISAYEKYNVKTILVGNKVIIEKYLSDNEKVLPVSLEIVNAQDTILMDEKPSVAIRKKKSSLIIAANLVKDGVGSALVSMGNTGAVMAASIMIIKRLDNVSRPPIAAYLPNINGERCVLIDGGANVDCKPHQLEQFAVIGSSYSKNLFMKPNPKVGLLTVGEEEGKGNELAKEVYERLKKTNINFIGNIESKDIILGKVDVAVCDGFVGNITLKTAEAVGEFFFHFIKDEIKHKFRAKIAALFFRPLFKKLYKLIDYNEYGGAPLLGLNNLCIIGHGKSGSKAVMNALKVADEFVKNNINEAVKETLLQAGAE